MDITDYKVYNNRMSKSLADKMFFINKIENNQNVVFVDFGCANGTLIKHMRTLRPNYHYIGIDNNEIMLNEARKNNTSADFYRSLEDVKKNEKYIYILNLSSVIHEIYSYLSKKDVDKLWKDIWSFGFDYICIRDMMVSGGIRKTSTEEEINKILNSKYTKQIADFEKYCGKISDYKNLIHFLLKYSYKENWDREVRENYLPLSIDEFMGIIPSDYEITYIKPCSVSFQKNKIKQDFGIDIIDNTHIKIILKNKRLSNA